MLESPLIATLEAGGTKMVAGFAKGPGEILRRKRVKTEGVEKTLAQLVEFFRVGSQDLGLPEALAVGAFGPVNLDRGSKDYGTIGQTPKEGWRGVNLLAPLRELLGGLPSVVETDVNAALFGELRWGAARGLKSAAYLTVGTGIGGALFMNGDLIRGVGHSEMGHMRVRRDEVGGGAKFTGVCPFHGDCLEGMASGSALRARWGRAAEELGTEHVAWEIEADYLAQACVNILMIAPPERIILGGGVMAQDWLFPLIRTRLKELLGGYLAYDELGGDLGSFVLPPLLGEDAGLLGCVALGQALLKG